MVLVCCFPLVPVDFDNDWDANVCLSTQQLGEAPSSSR